MTTASLPAPTESGPENSPCGRGGEGPPMFSELSELDWCSLSIETRRGLLSPPLLSLAATSPSPLLFNVCVMSLSYYLIVPDSWCYASLYLGWCFVNIKYSRGRQLSQSCVGSYWVLINKDPSPLRLIKTWSEYRWPHAPPLWVTGDDGAGLARMFSPSHWADHLWLLASCLRLPRMRGREVERRSCRQHQFVVFLLWLEQVCSTITYNCVESPFVEASFQFSQWTLIKVMSLQ